MPLDPATELRELDAILGSVDDPETKRARIAALYEEPAANDPSGGLPPEATAEIDPMAAVRQQRDAEIQQQTATDAAKPLAPAPYDPSGFEQAAKVSTDTPPGAERIAPGKAGFGQLAQDLGLVQTTTDPTAGVPLRPAPARVTTIPETTVQGAPKKPGAGGGGGPARGTPEWLTRSMAAEGLDTGRAFPKDPLGRPVTHAEEAGYRALEGDTLEQTREQGEAERQAILTGARAELAAVERGEIVDAELARREVERQNNLAAMERDFGEMLSEAEAEPIDSERLWNSKSTGEKVLSKVLMFIGTIGSSAATGNPMLVVNKMDADVERDIAAQKANKAFKLHALAAKGSLIDMARTRFASEQAVDAAMRETAWRKIDAQLKNMHAIAQDPARKAALELLMDGTESKILDAERQRRTVNEADTIARLRAAAAAQAARGKAERKNVEDPRYVPGLGFARTIKEAQDMRQAQADYLAGKRQFARARGFARDFSAKLGSTTLETGSKEFHEADALSQSLKNQVAKSFGGVITEGDRAAAAKEVPQLTRLWGGLDERLRMAEERYDRNYRSAIESTIIGAPIAPIPQQEGDAPAAPLPQGQMDRPIEKPQRTR